MSHTSVLGLYRPGAGWLFRIPVGWKYLLLVALTLPALVFVRWWLTIALVAVAVAVMMSSGLGILRILSIGRGLWVVLAFVAGFHLVTGDPLAAITHPGNLLLAVLAARILTLTTPTPELMDAVVAALRPLPWVDHERVALAIALMIRSIPYLLGAAQDARLAGQARGIDRNPALLLVPVLLESVAYAERTAEALAARGIGEDDQTH